MSHRGEALERVNKLIELELNALPIIEDARSFLEELGQDVDQMLHTFERSRRMKSKNHEEVG